MWEFKAVAVTYNKNSEVFVGLSESNFVHFNLSDSHNQNAGTCLRKMHYMDAALRDLNVVSVFR